MARKDIVIIADYSYPNEMTLDEVCEICSVSPDFINDLIDFEILQFGEDYPEAWSFDLPQVERIKTAQRLQHDLEVNLPGIAIILDLLDEMEKLRAQAALLEKHLLNR